MDRKTITKALQAASKYHSKAYDDAVNGAEKLNGYWMNVKTGGIVEGIKTGEDERNRLYLCDAGYPKNKLPRFYYTTTEFSKALLSTCEFGNAAGLPFVMHFKGYIGDNSNHFIAVSHKGNMSGKKFKTLGEAQQHGLKKLQFITPKWSEEEVEERTRDFMRRRVSEGMKIIKQEREKELQEQLLQAEREAILEAAGFGAW